MRACSRSNSSSRQARSRRDGQLPSFVYPRERDRSRAARDRVAVEAGGGERAARSARRGVGRAAARRRRARARSGRAHGVAHDRVGEVVAVSSGRRSPRRDLCPWGDSDGPKLSPVAAQALVLGHIRDAWDHAHADDAGARFADQEVLVTVPASFDEAARELTLQAAAKAGYPPVVLLEEPQAAFCIAWIDGQRGAKGLAAGDRVLVFDVSGGSTRTTADRCRRRRRRLHAHGGRRSPAARRRRTWI